MVATDGGGKSSWGIVHLTVDDANDHAPVFQLNEYRISVYSNLSLNSVFLQVKKNCLLLSQTVNSNKNNWQNLIKMQTKFNIIVTEVLFIIVILVSVLFN